MPVNSFRQAAALQIYSAWPACPARDFNRAASGFMQIAHVGEVAIVGRSAPTGRVARSARGLSRRRKEHLSAFKRPFPSHASRELDLPAGTAVSRRCTPSKTGLQSSQVPLCRRRLAARTERSGELAADHRPTQVGGTMYETSVERKPGL